VWASAQVYVPTRISLESGAQSNRVAIGWATIPGKTYDVLKTEQFGQAWTAPTNGAIRARSTLTNFTDPADSPMAFYRVRERALPTGNRLGITTTTVAETEKILGLTFTASQRTQMLQLLTDNTFGGGRTAFESMRTNRLLNNDPPSLRFNPLPIGFV